MDKNEVKKAMHRLRRKATLMRFYRGMSMEELENLNELEELALYDLMLELRAQELSELAAVMKSSGK